jgi:hypothetical protein
MPIPTLGEAVSKTYMVTIVETFRVEADSEDDAIDQVDALHHAHAADTSDVQVDLVTPRLVSEDYDVQDEDGEQ